MLRIRLGAIVARLDVGVVGCGTTSWRRRCRFHLPGRAAREEGSARPTNAVVVNDVFNSALRRRGELRVGASSASSASAADESLVAASGIRYSFARCLPEDSPPHRR
jgi:hypothetical protein